MPCEGDGRFREGLLTGKTPQDVIVDFEGDKSLIGQFVDVKIKQAFQAFVLGKAVE